MLPAAACSTGGGRSRGGERSPRAEAASWPKPCSHHEAAPAQLSQFSEVSPRRVTDPKRPHTLQRTRARLILLFSRGSDIQGRGSRSAADPAAGDTSCSMPAAPRYFIAPRFCSLPATGSVTAQTPWEGHAEGTACPRPGEQQCSEPGVQAEVGVVFQSKLRAETPSRLPGPAGGGSAGLIWPHALNASVRPALRSILWPRTSVLTAPWGGAAAAAKAGAVQFCKLRAP